MSYVVYLHIVIGLGVAAARFPNVATAPFWDILLTVAIWPVLIGGWLWRTLH
jgi:hypothetical protein